MKEDNIEKIFVIGDLHFGIKTNSLEWQDSQNQFIQDFIEGLDQEEDVFESVKEFGLDQDQGDWEERVADVEMAVLKGEIDMPLWMKAVMNETNWSGFNHSTEIRLLAKDPKYTKLGDKILKLLTSLEQEACQDG